ncbi:MAG: hypothetical protein IPL87_01560 [Candidatus Moraniibacteriota bacterium]|nr:MAG: hypothetical protein IPL87_01560 [Candidatus Moranbacteria bacterium]
MKKKFLIFLFALIAGATGCAGIPVSQDVTDTRSLDMNVQGCTVFTAVSVDGIGSDGRTYHRYGRVFFFPESGMFGYNPDFTEISGALSFMTGGIVRPGAEHVQYARLKRGSDGELILFLMSQGHSGKFQRTPIFHRDLRVAVELSAVFLQTGRNLSECPEVVFR